MSSTFDFEKIVSDIDQQQAAPLHLWHPELSGDIDISIDRQGVWRHCGDEFTRLKIPALFSRILCREGDEYFLKTPVEKNEASKQKCEQPLAVHQLKKAPARSRMEQKQQADNQK